MDVQKQIEYWRSGSAEDVDVASELLEKGRIRHALFFAHLSVEKLLKAHVTRTTAAVPPRIHNLVRLVEVAGLHAPPEHLEFLRRLNTYQMQGRYPDDLPSVTITQEDAQELLRGAREVLRWLMARF